MRAKDCQKAHLRYLELIVHREGYIEEDAGNEIVAGWLT